MSSKGQNKKRKPGRVLSERQSFGTLRHETLEALRKDREQRAAAQKGKA